jgi:divalent metal cation (Fe/Co/Zn/Cd) transporter
VSWATVAWSTTTGTASAIVGARAHSLSVVGLGVTVLIDVASSLVLIWRFGHERGGGPDVARAEHVAHRVASIALGAVGLALVVQAVRNLVHGSTAEVPALGVGLAAAGLVVLPLLARWKYRVADAVASAALRADAHITSVGAAMAGVTLAGLAVSAWWDLWWADSTAALAIAGAAIVQARAGLREG